jgi:hypothetical protein
MRGAERRRQSKRFQAMDRRGSSEHASSRHWRGACYAGRVARVASCWGWVLVGAAAVLAGCCGSAPDTDEGPSPGPQAERCAEDIGDAPAAIREVTLGSGDPFVAYADAEAVQLIRGYQGGYMVTPSIRVAASAGDGERACLRVALENAFDDGGDGPASPGVLAMLVFERRGDQLCVDDLYDLLGLDRSALTGRTLALTVRVTGTDFTATDTARVALQ